MLIFLGFAGNGFKRDTQVPLKPGEETTIGRYTLRNDGVKVSDDGQKQMVTAYLAVFEDGKQIDTLYPAQVVLPEARAGADDRGRDPPDVRRGPLRRAGVRPTKLATQVANLQIDVNPLVNWVWIGFGILALGTGIALLPERIVLVRAGEDAD